MPKSWILLAVLCSIVYSSSNLPAQTESSETETPAATPVQAALERRLIDPELPLKEVVLRGAAADWAKTPTTYEELQVRDMDDYLIRKLRFEAVPGLWIPAVM